MGTTKALTQVTDSSNNTCERITRQVALIAEREWRGLPVADEEAVLREMRITLGLAFAYEALLLADLRHGKMM